MTIDPKPGLVIRYDYLWRDEYDAGRIDGAKDRPCAIILAAKPRKDGHRDVVLCAITHTPPKDGESAVEIPVAVARHLGLDDDRSWIKTHEANVLTWEKGRVPFGITPVEPGKWTFGLLPYQLAKSAFDQVSFRIRTRSISTVRRDEE